MGKGRRKGLIYRLANEECHHHGTYDTKFSISDLNAIYEAIAALAATIYAVPLNDVSDGEFDYGVTNSSCAEDDTSCKRFGGPSSTRLLIGYGGIEYAVMVATYFLIQISRTKHVHIYRNLRDLNMALFGLNCIEMIFLPMLPLSFGIAISYGTGSQGPFALLPFCIVLLAIRLCKVSQILYIRSYAQELIVREPMSKEAAACSPGPCPLALYQFHILNINNFLAILIICAVIAMAFVTNGDISVYSLFLLLTIMTDLRIASCAIYFRRRLPAWLGLSDTTTARYEEHAKRAEVWVKWAKEKHWEKERWQIFRDGVFGFLITAVVLDVHPPTSWEIDVEEGDTLKEYLTMSLPYAAAYVAIACTMLSIYSMNYLTMWNIDDDVSKVGDALFFSFLNLPILMAMLLPYLVLLSMKLWVLSREEDSQYFARLFFYWLFIISLIMEGCFIILIRHRDRLAKNLKRNHAATSLAFGFSINISSIIGIILSHSTPPQYCIIVPYMVGFFWKFVDYFLTETLISKVWRGNGNDNPYYDDTERANEKLYQEDSIEQSEPMTIGKTLQEPLLAEKTM